MNVNSLILTVLFHLIIAVGTVKSQTKKEVDLSKALKVGDSFIPPKTVQFMRGDMKVIDWKALEDKVVILDFFDTYCGTCIELMPKLQKLQDKYADKVQIINVGWQDKQTLEKFYASNAYLKEHHVNLPVIYGDTYLKEHFPHQGAPHVVFLYKGQVHAITFFRQVTAENILALYEAGTINLPLKNDFGKVDLSADINIVKNLKTSIVITGYQDGVPIQGFLTGRDSITGYFKTSMVNRPIFRALVSTATRIKRPDFYLRDDRIVWKVKDPKKYEDFDRVGESWLNENGICYERTDEVYRPDSVQARLVLNDLHNALGIKTYYSTKTMKSVVLKREAVRKSKAPKTGSGRVYENSRALAESIESSGFFPTAVDLVKSKDHIHIGSFNNLDELNDQLGPYGIVAVIEDQDIPVFVVEEVD
ncbi:TlpA disulfide reductase family protein [Sphingobacterium sp.]|uniref:TlpA family protein disulfide reductase n=1 Tax=Sphingobacterium sp. TaxID=341027 RepID=UPI0028992EBF|nr:TlpA disulfide reductase family protein [Sphingobacterium sp.]